ncbi:MAG: hypothetical protein HN576_13580 [Bacteriovoracaceae bacterium]|nr:hypothetical protein [Bacteriovoracaceae bacterium]
MSAIKVLPINTLPELKKIKNEPFSAEVIIEEKCSSDCPIRFLKFIDIKIEGTPVVGLENAPSKIVKESKCNFK